MRALFGVLLCSVVPGVSAAQTTFTVTNSGFTAYLVNGQVNPSLTLTRGLTYTFNVTATGHPFYIKTQQVTGTGSRYDTGVTGQGATSGSVVFQVPQDAPNTLYYQCSIHGTMTGILNIVDALDVPGVGAPGTVWLAMAVPNPARDGTMFRFGLPRPAPINFTIIDARGRAIREVARGDWSSGDHTLRWDGRDGGGNRVPSGVYFYRLSVEGRILVRRLSLTR